MDYSLPDLTSTPEVQFMPSSIYDMQIVGVRGFTKQETQRKSIIVDFAFVDHPEAEQMTVFFSLPKPDDKPKAKLLMNRGINRLLYWFNIPNQDGNFDTDDFLEQTGTVPVELGKDFRGNIANIFPQGNLPAIPQEEEETDY